MLGLQIFTGNLNFPIFELTAMKQPNNSLPQNKENTIRNIVRVFMFQQRLVSKHYRLCDLKLAEGCLKLSKIRRELKRLSLLPK